MYYTSSDKDIVTDYTYNIYYLIIASQSIWHTNSQWYYEVGNTSIPVSQMRNWSLGSLICLPEVTLLLCLPGSDFRQSGFWVWASNQALIASSLAHQVLLCLHYFYSTEKNTPEWVLLPFVLKQIKIQIKISEKTVLMLIVNNNYIFLLRRIDMIHFKSFG